MSDELKVNNQLVFIQPVNGTDFDMFLESMMRTANNSKMVEAINSIDRAYGCGILSSNEGRCFWSKEGRRITFRNVGSPGQGHITIRMEGSPGPDAWWIENHIGIKQCISENRNFHILNNQSTDFVD